jgi:DNA-binding transcriptional LysR family regulator
LANYFLNKVLVEFHQKFPRVLVSIELNNCCDPHALLASNKTDLVFTEKSVADGRFEFFPLFTDSFHIAVSPEHPWAVKGSVTLSEFPKAPFILHRNLAHSQRMLAEYLKKNDVALNTIAEMDSLDSIKDFVRQTRAISILPTWATQRELREGTLAALPLGRKPFEQMWGFTRWHERPLNHSEASFVHLCRSTLAAMPSKSEMTPLSILPPGPLQT